MIYADSSLLVPLLVPEAGSRRAMEMVSARGVPLILGILHALELENAVRLKVFRGEISEAQADEALRQRDGLMKSGAWVMATVSAHDSIARAIALSRAHTMEMGARSLDLIHVGMALELGCEEFWTFDERQREVAARAGLSVNS